jgi:hypothetical protein
LNHYSKIILRGNITLRTGKIANKACYHYIVNNIFDNVDYMEKCTKINILTPECINIIKKLNNINAQLTGPFIDYLIRRIFCEIIGEPFYDNRVIVYYHEMNTIIQ